MNEIIKKSIQSEFMKKKTAKFRSGDTIKIYVKIFEGDKSRVQAFEGIVTRIKNAGLEELFTVRRVSFGIGVERTFFTHSPIIDKIKLVREGKVRRSKLYYLRKKSGKESRVLLKGDTNQGLKTKVDETKTQETKPDETIKTEIKAS